MPRLDGESGTDLWTMMDDAGRVELARATGVALVRLHEASSSFFGPYDGQMDDFIEMDDFPDWFLHRLDFTRRDCRSVNALPTEAELMIDELIEENREALGEPFTPVLVHHDFKVQNLNFEPAARGFDAAGVFDLFEAYLADGEEDIVRSLWLLKTDEERTAFLRAYTDVHPLRPGARERLTLYALADWLVIWSYRTRHGLTGDATFVESVKPILDYARAAAD
jgi:fructosamine-3-kinase